MTTSLQSLGALIQSYRLESGMSQRELASKTHPPVSRSTIADFENGRLLPTPHLVATICRILSIPRSLWERFLNQTDRVLVRSGTYLSDSLPRYIAVSGVSGSGKTTLVKSLSQTLGYAQLPEARAGLSYLPDLSTDPARWAFETQLAFLAHKAVNLKELLSRGARVIVDRSLSEDVDVFAKYWHSCKKISDRAYSTYLALSEHLLSTLPKPDLVIYCNCSLVASISRISSRGRNDVLHTAERLESQYSLYRQWKAAYRDGPMLSVDTERFDVRDIRTVRQVATDLAAMFATGSDQDPQLDLFAIRTLGASTRPLLPAILCSETNNNATPNPPHGGASSLLQPKAPVVLAYLAAPFSSAESPPRHPATMQILFSDTPKHGVIPRGPYRNSLLQIERKLKSLGVRTWIPHRDINRWGTRSITPPDAAHRCSDWIHACDFLVAILGVSMGAHYEIGLARGLSKPIVVVACDDQPSSFIGNGLQQGDWPDTIILRSESLAEAHKQFLSTDFQQFIARYVPISKVRL